MPLQSTSKKTKKKPRQKLKLIGIGISSTLPTTLQAVKHGACGVIWSVLLVVLALRYVSQKHFSLDCRFQSRRAAVFLLLTFWSSLFKFFGLWLPSQLYPVETLERQPTPRSSSATECCFPTLWRMPAGRATRPLASLLAIAPPMAPGPAQHQIASVRTATFTLFDHSKMFYPNFVIIRIAYAMYPVSFTSCTTTRSTTINKDWTCQLKFHFLS